jgi:hypothetical protein
MNSYIQKIKPQLQELDEDKYYNDRPNLKFYIKMLIILPNPISMFISKIYYGYRDCGEAFFVWKYIMRNDYSVVAKKLFNMSAIDQLYIHMKIQDEQNDD